MREGEHKLLLIGFDSDALVERLSQHYSVATAATSEEAHAVLSADNIALVMCHHIPGRFDAIPFLRRLRIDAPEIVRIVGGSLSESDLMGAINDAAVYQFFPQDWEATQIDLIVRRALESRELAYRHRRLSRELHVQEDFLSRRTASELQQGGRFGELVYDSESMQTLVTYAAKTAATDLSVLIEGETGTGKDVMARAIHQVSGRSEQPLMVQNCGGLSDDLLLSELFGHKKGAFTSAVSDRLGLLPAADGGTVFLDEIGTVSERFQTALLRFLQNGEVKPLGSDRVTQCDVRVIAATNQSLEKLVQTGAFREDLYFRLNVFKLSIPPLRDRKAEIPSLALHFAQQYGEETGRRINGLDDRLLGKLMTYSWPGNVRELENEIRRLVALSDGLSVLGDTHLSPHFSELPEAGSAPVLEGTLKEQVETLEREVITQTLDRLRWNQTRAAEVLGLSRVGLANKIRRYALRETSHA